jgi:hypothetical protein
MPITQLAPAGGPIYTADTSQGMLVLADCWGSCVRHRDALQLIWSLVCFSTAVHVLEIVCFTVPGRCAVVCCAQSAWHSALWLDALADDSHLLKFVLGAGGIIA